MNTLCKIHKAEMKATFQFSFGVRYVQFAGNTNVSGY